MTDLAKLVVRLEAQTGQYAAQLEKAQSQLSRFERAGTSALNKIGGLVAGAAAAVGFVSLGKAAIDAADRMNDLSKQTGISVEQLSRLDYAAQQSGASGEVLIGAFRKLTKAAVESRDGTGEAAEAFKALGISVVDANGNLKDGQALLLETAQAFSEQEDGAAKSAAAMRLFGKSGAELIPFLNEGADGIQKLMDKADQLGATMSGEAARAADEFNDSLNSAKAATLGLVRDAITPLLPVLTETIEAFLGGADGARDLSGATSFLQTGLKLLTDVGMSVVYTFNNIGKSLGNIAAAAAAVATGRFREAADIWRMGTEDALARQEAFSKALTKLWSDGMDETISEVTVRAKKIGLAMRLGVKSTAPTLEEVSVSAAKIYVSPMERLYEQLDEQTQTTGERQIAAFRKTEAAINELVAAGRISPQEAAARTSEALDEVLPEIEVKVEKIGNKIKDTTKDVSEFTKRAMELTVDTIADGLYGAIKGGLKDIPEAFGDMLLKLALQAQAARIGEMLFGTAGNGYKGSGFLGTIGSLIGSVVGPGKAVGGPVSPGTIYPVNENTPNTEYFAPAVAGTIIPNKSLGARTIHVSNHFTVQAPNPAVARQTQAQIATSAGRGLSMALRKNG